MGLNALSSIHHPSFESLDGTRESRMTVLLLVSAPVAFFASSLDCTGLSLRGCTPFCTVIKLVWIPLIAGVCAWYHIARDRRALAALSIGSFVPIVPHCICYNAANGWWIDHIGASPECYAWGFVVTGLVVGSLAAGKRYLITLGVSLLIIGGSLGFFVAHHYFRFPW
jgi:hypothetical protein